MQRYTFPDGQRASSQIAVGTLLGVSGLVFLLNEDRDAGLLIGWVRSGDAVQLSVTEYSLDHGEIVSGVPYVFEFTGDYALLLIDTGVGVWDATGTQIVPTETGVFTVTASGLSSVVMGGVALWYAEKYLTFVPPLRSTSVYDFRVWIDPDSRVGGFPVSIKSGKYYGPQRYRS